MVAEKQRIESLRKPPDGWFYSQEARDQRRSERTRERVFHRGASTTGPRDDAEPTATLPTLTPGRDKLPQACIWCRNRLLSQEPPLGEHQRGMLSCTGCSRQLAWLTEPLAPRAVASPPAPSPAPVSAPASTRVTISGRFKRLDGCGPACGVIYGHDPDTHEAYGESIARDELRREAEAALTGVVRTGPLLIDCDAMEVTLDGAVVRLTATEVRIVATLAQQPGRLWPAAALITEIWGAAIAAEVCPGPDRDPRHTLSVNLTRVRQKLGPAARLLETRVGLGYVLRVEPPTGGDA